ncbi:cysteine proteinase [Colletotrichum zoysiae]|uniref:Cysteine proteinase n=1 Tax=Colletotrichum zoysiae TaxID=1216348 RepID=A0AAD9M527_9PEZI|nr:cysteine proteinase [Colletotrichum zoysiae]
MASSLTPEDLDHYLEYISLPNRYRGHPADLELLSNLQLYHICAIPYENLGLHYAKDVDISLDVQKIFRKCTSNGRGGYCMENTIFFNHVLRSLGFDVYVTGARARPRVNDVPQGDYTGWMHVVNIVKLDDGTRYMVDVGFGGDLATKPLPLIPGRVTLNLGTQEVRLDFDKIPHMSSDQKLWIYQYRNSPTQPWNASFCFTEVEFLPQDLEVMNFYTSRSTTCFQTFTLLVVKFLRRGDELYGKRMLVNRDVKENLGGTTNLIRECVSEEERITALREMFGIILTEEETWGIKGRVSEITNPK